MPRNAQSGPGPGGARRPGHLACFLSRTYTRFLIHSLVKGAYWPVAGSNTRQLRSGMESMYEYRSLMSYVMFLIVGLSSCEARDAVRRRTTEVAPHNEADARRRRRTGTALRARAAGEDSDM